MTVDDWTIFERRVVGVIVALAEGEVVSYGDVAHDAGYPGRARAVGRAARAVRRRAAVVAGGAR